MEKVRVARMSVASNTVLVAGKVGVGLAINSVSVLAEAAHSGIDLLAALIAYFSVREASKPADERHPFGHGKIENLSGTIEAGLIFLAAAWILYEAVHRLAGDGAVQATGPGLAVMGASAAVNWFVSARLFQAARQTHSVALEADALHLRTDVWTSLGVFAGLLGIRLTGWQALDSLAAIAVALLVVKAAYDLTRTSFLPLLDVSLPPEEQEVILKTLEEYRPRYLEVHMLRTRRAGAERHIDLHMVLPKVTPLYESHRLCDEIEAALAARIPHAHVLIHVEPCDQREGLPCEADCRACYPFGAASAGGAPPAAGAPGGAGAGTPGGAAAPDGAPTR